MLTLARLEYKIDEEIFTSATKNSPQFVFNPSADGTSANVVQFHSLLPDHYACHDLRFSIVRNVNIFLTSLQAAWPQSRYATANAGILKHVVL